MKSVIVIGGSGFLGSAVITELLKGSYNIFATQNKTPINFDGVTVIKGGISALTDHVIREINPIVIFHCARPTFKRFRKLGRKYAAIRATQLNSSLIRQIKQSTINPTLIFASGSLVYGNSNSEHNELAPLNPISYARQYYRGEVPVMEALRSNDIPVHILRFPWLLGNGSWYYWFYLKNIVEKNVVPLFGDGMNRMSILDLNDAAKLMIEYSNQKLDSGVFNIYSPLKPTQLEFVKMLSKHYECDIIDYKEIYKNGVESAVLEAFKSNIIMKSNYESVLNHYSFRTLDQSLCRT
jgi:nucleoside-diphosphate-sugar epimerase